MKLLLILHFLALSAALGGTFANMIAKHQMTKVDPSVHSGIVLTSATIRLMSAAGLAILWITGIWMTGLTYDVSGVPILLWVKIAVAALLTTLVIRLNFLFWTAKRKKTRPDGRTVDQYAYAIGALGILVVCLAVFLFD